MTAILKEDAHIANDPERKQVVVVKNSCTTLISYLYCIFFRVISTLILIISSMLELCLTHLGLFIWQDFILCHEA